MGANFGIAGMDWQQRVNWDRLREYRIERARQMMKEHWLGALLCMYDENCRYITGTLTPGWNRLKPGLRYAMLCGDGRPVLFEQGDIGFQIERHALAAEGEDPALLRLDQRCSRSGSHPASDQVHQRDHRGDASPRRCRSEARRRFHRHQHDPDFKEKNIAWVDGMTPMMEARAVKSEAEHECFRIVGAIGDATHWECMKFLRPGVTENQVTAHLMQFLHNIPGMEASKTSSFPQVRTLGPIGATSPIGSSNRATSCSWIWLRSPGTATNPAITGPIAWARSRRGSRMTRTKPRSMAL